MDACADIDDPIQEETPGEAPEPMAARHSRLLAELADLGMDVAREMAGQVKTAPTPDEKQKASGQFAHASRAVRQTLALESRLRTDDRREQVERDALYDREISRRIRRRKTRVNIWMHRHIAEAYDPRVPSHERAVKMHIGDLAERLDDDLLDESFLEMPFDDLITKLRADLGLPDPAEDEEDDDDEDWDDEDEDPDDPDDDDDDDGDDDPDDEDPDDEDPDVIEGEARWVAGRDDSRPSGSSVAFQPAPDAESESEPEPDPPPTPPPPDPPPDLTWSGPLLQPDGRPYPWDHPRRTPAITSDWW